ncbi:MAG: hypothetical protein ACLQFR_12620 [Streptosporangiaceae bacterium]
MGRHADGVVDAYFGRAALNAAVQAAPAAGPGTIAAAAGVLLEELDDGWLRDQVTGLRTCAHVLAGQAGPYADEVAGCYGCGRCTPAKPSSPPPTNSWPTCRPGAGPLAGRCQRRREQTLGPAGQVEPVMATVIAEARAQTSALVHLPAGEGVMLETVPDAPWLGYNRYLGDLRGGSWSTSGWRCRPLSC